MLRFNEGVDKYAHLVTEIPVMHFKMSWTTWVCCRRLERGERKTNYFPFIFSLSSFYLPSIYPLYIFPSLVLTTLLTYNSTNQRFAVFIPLIFLLYQRTVQATEQLHFSNIMSIVLLYLRTRHGAIFEGLTRSVSHTFKGKPWS